MTRVAFYAPMKPPSHPTPSGDREMARHLMAAIGARARVGLASDLRVHDRSGDAAHQAAMYALASAEVHRLTAALAGADTALWVTYHNYYKAPDLIGPAVCRALNLPYVQIESTRARRRLSGPWAGFAAAAETAADAADLIFYLTELDLIALTRDRPPAQRLIHLRPFLPTDTMPAPADCRTGPMLSVAMMRPGVRDVLLSGSHPAPEAGPKALAQTLTHLLNDPAARQSQGSAARQIIARNHLSQKAGETFWAAVTPMLEHRK